MTNLKFISISAACLLMSLAACKSGESDSASYPPGFEKMTDEERVTYVMQNVSPDSLARFVVDGALGRNPKAPIDSLAIANLYIYEHLRAEDLDAYSMQYETYVESLPLNDKMKIYMLEGSEDPAKIGYKLGLEYLGTIREHNKKADEVEKELKSFKKACGNDTDTYRRFIIGFHTVLEVDSGKDIDREVYTRFKDYE